MAARSPQSHAASSEGAPGGELARGGEGAWEAQPGQTGGTLPRVHSANTLRQAPRESTSLQQCVLHLIYSSVNAASSAGMA